MGNVLKVFVITLKEIYFSIFVVVNWQFGLVCDAANTPPHGATALDFTYFVIRYRLPTRRGDVPRPVNRESATRGPPPPRDFCSVVKWRTDVYGILLLVPFRFYNGHSMSRNRERFTRQMVTVFGKVRIRRESERFWSLSTETRKYSFTSTKRKLKRCDTNSKAHIDKLTGKICWQK